MTIQRFEDMIVWKEGYIKEQTNPDGSSTKIFESPVTHFKYTIGEVYTIDKLEIKQEISLFGKPLCSVYEGFHSYANIPVSIFAHNSDLDPCAIAGCVIPKGSKVYFGTSCDIVSDHIRIDGFRELSKVKEDFKI